MNAKRTVYINIKLLFIFNYRFNKIQDHISDMIILSAICLIFFFNKLDLFNSQSRANWSLGNNQDVTN